MRAEIAVTAVYRAQVSQDLRRVPILQHCLVLVERGAKELVADDGAAVRVAAGGTALLYAGGRPSIGKRN